MECINKTVTFRESVQKSLENACCAFSETENMMQISRNTGIRPTMLRSKLNPHQPHRLAVDELILITKDSGNYCIIDSLLLSLDMVAVKVDRTASDETLVKRALVNSVNSGELAELVLESAGETRLPRSKRNALLARAHRSVNNLVLLMSDLENKTQGISPMLSMSLDFVVNGAPIPGIM